MGSVIGGMVSLFVQVATDRNRRSAAEWEARRERSNRVRLQYGYRMAYWWANTFARRPK